MADANSVIEQLAGTQSGKQLPWALVDLLRVATIFDLDTTQVFPEGENVSSSRLDQITTLAKILAVRHQGPDGKLYTVSDAIFTLLDAFLASSAK